MTPGSVSCPVFPTLMACDSFSVTARVPPVVPDTNVLRRDLGRSCKGGRTVLVNAANSGAVRLLCPAHVVVEMFEHAELFSSQMRLPVATYLQVWRRDYLPLLRVVDGLPSGMWTAGEEARISELERRDPDDVPAARLALAVGAYFVSTDGGPLEAVYGRPVDASIHDKWVTTLKSGVTRTSLRTCSRPVRCWLGLWVPRPPRLRPQHPRRSWP